MLTEEREGDFQEKNDSKSRISPFSKSPSAPGSRLDGLVSEHHGSVEFYQNGGTITIRTDSRDYAGRICAAINVLEVLMREVSDVPEQVLPALLRNERKYLKDAGLSLLVGFVSYCYQFDDLVPNGDPHLVKSFLFTGASENKCAQACGTPFANLLILESVGCPAGTPPVLDAPGTGAEAEGLSETEQQQESERRRGPKSPPVSGETCSGVGAESGLALADFPGVAPVAVLVLKPVVVIVLVFSAVSEPFVRVLEVGVVRAPHSGHFELGEVVPREVRQVLVQQDRRLRGARLELCVRNLLGPARTQSRKVAEEAESSLVEERLRSLRASDFSAPGRFRFFRRCCSPGLPEPTSWRHSPFPGEKRASSSWKPQTSASSPGAGSPLGIGIGYGADPCSRETALVGNVRQGALYQRKLARDSKGRVVRKPHGPEAEAEDPGVHLVHSEPHLLHGTSALQDGQGNALGVPVAKQKVVLAPGLPDLALLGPARQTGARGPGRAFRGVWRALPGATGAKVCLDSQAPHVGVVLLDGLLPPHDLFLLLGQGLSDSGGKLVPLDLPTQGGLHCLYGVLPRARAVDAFVPLVQLALAKSVVHFLGRHLQGVLKDQVLARLNDHHSAVAGGPGIGPEVPPGSLGGVRAVVQGGGCAEHVRLRDVYRLAGGVLDSDEARGSLSPPLCGLLGDAALHPLQSAHNVRGPDSGRRKHALLLEGPARPQRTLLVQKPGIVQGNARLEDVVQRKPGQESAHAFDGHGRGGEYPRPPFGCWPGHCLFRGSDAPPSPPHRPCWPKQGTPESRTGSSKGPVGVESAVRSVAAGKDALLNV
ncbi:hypothetical protein HWI79_3220, partial [Cryptosporidium felis]